MPAPATGEHPYTPSPGLILHLSGPIQSWGERSKFTQRDTARMPTRSGLIGMIAAARGIHRDEPIKELAQLRFTVRVDRPGSLLRDFHTVGGGYPRERTVATAEGGRRGGDTATLVSTRYYLQDAAFTVAVTAAAPTDEAARLLARCGEALQEPFWPPYLGRRSCPAGTPIYVTESDDTWHSLGSLPIHRKQPWKPDDLVEVTYWGDQPMHQLPTPAGWQTSGAETSSTITDDPHIAFGAMDRTYRRRDLYRRDFVVPAKSCAGLGATYLKRLSAALQTAAAKTPDDSNTEAEQ